MGIPKDRKLFFNIAIGVELTHVGPQFFDLLLVLDAGLGTLYRAGMTNVVLHCLFTQQNRCVKNR
jgi:hypothetical protein